LDLGLTRNLNEKKYFVAGIKESTQQTHKFVVRKKTHDKHELPMC
jgi:hypothetical protein